MRARARGSSSVRRKNGRATLCSSNEATTHSVAEGKGMNAKSKRLPTRVALAAGLFGMIGYGCGAADAAVRIDGQVQAGGGPVASSTVTSVGRERRRSEATRSSENGGRRELCARRRCDARTGREPLPRRQGRRRGGQQGRGRQSGARVSGGARRNAAGEGRRQRNDDRRIGLDQRAVPRRGGDQGSGAQSQHRRR